jgi:hypothetical protein
MVEIEILAGHGVGCFRMRIGRTLFVLIMTLVSASHFHI